MTIDERIEALTQSVELLATFHRDSEARMQASEARMQASEAMMQASNARMDKLVSAVETLTAHMQTLATIALQHDQRIQKLES